MVRVGSWDMEIADEPYILDHLLWPLFHTALVAKD